MFYLTRILLASFLLGICVVFAEQYTVDAASAKRASGMITDSEDLLSPAEILSGVVCQAPSNVQYKQIDASKSSLHGELDDGSVTVFLQPETGSWDISNFAYFRVDMINSGKGLVWVQGRLENNGAEDWDRSTSSLAYIMPGERATLGFAFPRSAEKNDAPAIFDSQYSKPNGHRQHWKPFYPEEVVACRLEIRSSSEAFSLEEIQLSLAQPYGADKNAQLLELPYLDRFGQVKQLDWSGKIWRENELRERDALEREKYGDDSPASFNQYGGWADGPSYEATGYFRLQRHLGRWWFVDPEGKLFFSNGANSVGFGQRTPVASREDLFSWLPNIQEMAGTLRKGKVYFTIANLYRTFGDDWEEDAYVRLQRRMRRWGINTVGAWSDAQLSKRASTPYTAIIHVGHQYSPLGVQISDPFSGAFQQALRKGLRKLLKEGQPDPWCLGVFIDNEIYWSQKFIRKAFKNGSSQPARLAALEWLKAKYQTVKMLNNAWGTSYLRWDTLGALPEVETPAFTEDLVAMRGLLAAEYYSTCRRIMREELPNILYLGSRIHKAPDEVMAAAVRYTDVLSLNSYEPLAGAKIPTGIDKPCLISEFHFGAPDRGVPGPGLSPVGDQLQRSRAYLAYMMDGVLDPNVVGAHWFSYADQSAAGRPGENFQVGFVDVTDSPYPEITKASQLLARWMYQVAGENPVDLLESIESVLGED